MQSKEVINFPKCKNCPIIKECNANAVYVNHPVKWKDGKPVEFVKDRVCPLIIMLANIQPRPPEIRKIAA